MIFDVIVYRLDKIPADVYKNCYNYNFRNMGSMREYLVDFKGSKEGLVVVAYNKGKFAGWCLRTPYDYSRKGEDLICTYILRDFRRKGLGKILFKEAERYWPEHCVVITNESRQKAFYESIINKNKTRTKKERQCDIDKSWAA